MNIESILLQLPGVVFWKDIDSSYIGANDAFHKLAGLKNKSLSGKNDFDMPWNAFADKYRADDHQAIMKGGIRTIELVPTCKGSIIGTVEKRPIIERHKVIGVTCNLTPLIQDQAKQEIVLNKQKLNVLFNRISIREAEVLYFVVRGFSMRQVGHKLYISSKTVESHIDNIKLKFNVTSKMELINMSINLGFSNCIPESMI